MSINKHHLCQKQSTAYGNISSFQPPSVSIGILSKEAGGNLLEQGHLLGLLQEVNWKFYIKCTQIYDVVVKGCTRYSI